MKIFIGSGHFRFQVSRYLKLSFYFGGIWLGLVACNKEIPVYEDMRPEVYQVFHASNRLLNSGEVHRAIAYLDSAYATLDKPNLLEIWNKHYYMATYHINYVPDLDRAAQYKDSMDIVFKGVEDVYKSEYSRNFFMEGDVLKAKKRYAEAFKSYYKGREFARAHLSPCYTASLTYQLGLFKYGQREYEESIPYFKQAFEEISQCGEGSPSSMVMDSQMYLNTIALAYQKSQALDSAFVYYNHALSYISSKASLYPDSEFPAESHFLEMARGVVLGNLGGLLAEQGKTDEAIDLLRESILINDRPGYEIPDARTAKVKLADVYLQIGKLDDARELIIQLDSSIASVDVKNSRYFDILSRFHRLRWKYHDLVGNLDSAYRDLLISNNLYESTEKTAAESKYLDMEESFRIMEQQYLLSLVSRENEIKNIYLVGFVSFSLIAVVFIINVSFNLKRYRIVNERLRSQNKELEDAMTALEQSQKENSKMMHIVAHDLRNPISSMTMIADVLLESTTLNGEDRMLLEHIKLSGNNSLNLVSEMLRVNTDSEGLKKELVDLERMLSYCVDLLHHKAEEKNQKIVLEMEPVSALLSREKIWRVLSNLIANAIKFSQSGRPIKIRMWRKDNLVTIAVIDQGIGIPDKLKDSVFELFTDSRREGTIGEATYGMGLAISKQIVTAHDGRIWFESEEGKGTTFYVELPIA